MPAVDYNESHKLLEDAFAEAESAFLSGKRPTLMHEEMESACAKLFTSSTQAYREVLLGCVIARMSDPGINVREPYVGLGPNSFNGRTLDERVVNPFLHDKGIPCTRGPYLSVFRRSVGFDDQTRQGLRDQEGYDAFLTLVTYLEELSDVSQLRAFLLHLLDKFVELREQSTVSLSQLHRISLEQYDALIDGLLATPSGGRFPVMVVVATFQTIAEHFKLDWDVQYQGINVADTATRAGGDITISIPDRVLMAAEITERPIDRARLVATFKTKIAPLGIEDYLFFIRSTAVEESAKEQARRYFAHGHEVNFLETKAWILMVLASVGSPGRLLFNKKLRGLLDARETPKALKVAWNEQVAKITSM